MGNPQSEKDVTKHADHLVKSVSKEVYLSHEPGGVPDLRRRTHRRIEYRKPPSVVLAKR
jgi:hypothetical protein